MRQYFEIYELVPKKVYEDRGNKAFELIDKDLLMFINMLRSELDKPITVNDWFWGGRFSQRGLRTPEAKEFKPYSQHSFGRALDFNVKGMSAAEVREWIIEHRDLDWVKPITFMEDEDGIERVHVDTRYSETGDLVLYNVPKGTARIFKRS